MSREDEEKNQLLAGLPPAPKRLPDDALAFAQAELARYEKEIRREAWYWRGAGVASGIATAVATSALGSPHVVVIVAAYAATMLGAWLCVVVRSFRSHRWKE